MAPKKNEDKFVSKEEFGSRMSSLEGSVLQMVEMMKEKNQPQVIKDFSKEVAAAKEVEEAKAYQAPINPAWEAHAREVLGEKLDHCEVSYPKSGGLRFTVVIKNDFSNAPKDYLERYKSDRRTREVGVSGFEGVKKWCLLVKQNLNKK